MRQPAISIALLLFCSVPNGIALGESAIPSQKTPAPEVSVNVGPSVVALDGPWKFHIGDDPSWSDPDYNDSSWETVDLQAKGDALDPQSGVTVLTLSYAPVELLHL